MKRKWLWTLLLILVVVLSLYTCSKTRLRANQDVTLIFVYEDKNINVLLPEDEAAKVIEILNSNPYDPSILVGYPSCGFDQNIALKVGNRHFAVACDTCNCIQDGLTRMYFDIPKEDMAYIHSLFEKYGGYFPCI